VAIFFSQISGTYYTVIAIFCNWHHHCAYSIMSCPLGLPHAYVVLGSLFSPLFRPVQVTRFALRRAPLLDAVGPFVPMLLALIKLEESTASCMEEVD